MTKSAPNLYSNFLNEDTGDITNVAYVDGYSVGDRLLERVMFRCEILPDGSMLVDVVDDSREYFSHLNQEKWLTKILDYVYRCDTFYEDEFANTELTLVKNS